MRRTWIEKNVQVILQPLLAKKVEVVVALL